MNYDYRKLEVDMQAVLTALGGCLSVEEVQEVRAFVDAGEYGVAFETLCSIIAEERKSISVSVRNSLVKLGEGMDIDPEYYRKLESS